MSNLKTILDRLVQDNLHGPVDHANKDALKNHTTRQAAAAATPGAAGRGNPQDNRSNNSTENKTEAEEDLDARDPRWRQLFQEFFLSEHSDDRNDDLLFFVQKASFEVENGGLGVDPVFVKRKVKGAGTGQGVLTEEQEAVVLWKDTFFLNVIVQLPCKLTVAVCSRVTETNPITGLTKASMTCTRKHVSKRVYALPTKSRVDVKEATVECSWPLIYYVIDDYEDMFEQVMVQDNEFLCVELAVTLPSITTTTLGPSSPTSSPPHQRSRDMGQDAHWSQPPQGNDGFQVGKPFPSTSGRGNGNGSKITLFQGAAGFQSLLGIYQQKAASKVGRRFKFGPHTVPTEFVMMRGPGGRGHAQVAITASNVGDELPMASLDGGSLTEIPGSPVRDTPPLRHGLHSTSPVRPTSEKNLPPIPNPNAANESDHGHRHHHHRNNNNLNLNRNHPQHRLGKVKINTPSLPLPIQSAPISSPVSPNPKSFSAGSFFNSLRRISLATLAQATAGPTNTSPANSNSSALSQSHANGNNKSSHSIGSINAPSSPSSNSLNSAMGVGSRQEIEALVRQPQSLRCCMTFVNVPWTRIVALLMDHAYNSNNN
ncbi:hypothetical protein EDD21DRAFT_1431 [Dissophora ornata]|nr:hypothetical protein EDD21DRAFT_1431 [Dissophora ornata]